MPLIMKLQDLQRESGMLLMIRITQKFETKVIKSNIFDYSDTYILVTGDVKIVDVGANTNVAFKNCAPFTRCVTHINDEHIDTAETRNIIMPITI